MVQGVKTHPEANLRGWRALEAVWWGLRTPTIWWRWLFELQRGRRRERVGVVLLEVLIEGVVDVRGITNGCRRIVDAILAQGGRHLAGHDNVWKRWQPTVRCCRYVPALTVSNGGIVLVDKTLLIETPGPRGGCAGRIGAWLVASDRKKAGVDLCTLRCNRRGSALLSSGRIPLIDRTDAIDVLILRCATAYGRRAQGKGALAHLVLRRRRRRWRHLSKYWRAETHHKHQQDHEFAFHGLPFQAKSVHMRFVHLTTRIRRYCALACTRCQCANVVWSDLEWLLHPNWRMRGKVAFYHNEAQPSTTALPEACAPGRPSGHTHEAKH